MSYSPRYGFRLWSFQGVLGASAEMRADLEQLRRQRRLCLQERERDAGVRPPQQHRALQGREGFEGVRLPGEDLEPFRHLPETPSTHQPDDPRWERNVGGAGRGADQQSEGTGCRGGCGVVTKVVVFQVTTFNQYSLSYVSEHPNTVKNFVELEVKNNQIHLKGKAPKLTKDSCT